MGTASSVRSKPPRENRSTLIKKLDQERERKYQSTVETEEKVAKQQLEHEARLAELKHKNEQLEESMIRMRAQIKVESERWQQEKSDTLHMMFSKWACLLQMGVV